MSRHRKEQRIKEQNISKGVLLRMFEEHQLESLGDIAELYRKLERSLGYRSMKFEEYVNVSGSSGGTHAFFYLSDLVRWKKQCVRWNLNPTVVELLARDNATIAAIMRELNYSRVQTVYIAQGCLTVWSVDKSRCGVEELYKNIEGMQQEEKR